MNIITMVVFVLGGSIVLCVLWERLYQWNINRMVRRSIEKVEKDIAEGKVSDERILEKSKNGVITIEADKVLVKTRDHELAVEWDKIDKIMCFKEDLWVVDLACIGFSYADEQKMTVATEEMSGFVDLKLEIEKRYPGFEDKYHKWLFGTEPFDRNLHILWDRKKQSTCDDLTG